MKKPILGLLLILLFVIGGGLLFASRPPTGTSNNQTQPPSVTPVNLNTGPAPWPVETDHLRDRLAAAGLTALAQEGTALHLHQHIDIFVNNQPVSVPAGIGINNPAGFISPLHTHDPDSIIHVESPQIRDFTLGQFFDVWGVRFTDTCLGGYCTDASNKLQVFINGQPQAGNFPQIVLQNHQEIVITFSPSGQPLRPIPASFNFPSDL